MFRAKKKGRGFVYAPTIIGLRRRAGPIQDGRLGRLTESWTGMGRPVPVPPQLLQGIRPDPEQERHPTCPSDQREQRQVTLPVPLQVGHRVNGPAMGSWSMTDLTRTAPASMPRPS